MLVVNTSPWHIKLADFGLSKQLTESMAFDTKCGTWPYQAPEIRFDYFEDDDEGNKMTSAVDIWATGCIVYNLITGALPFPSGSSGSSNLKSYCKGASNFPHHQTLDPETTAFIQLLLSPRYLDRPPAFKALQHTWLEYGKFRFHCRFLTSTRRLTKKRINLNKEASQVVSNQSWSL